jgi:hypothetical protein
MSNGKYPTGNQTMDTAPFNAGAPLQPHSGIFVGFLSDKNGNVIRDGDGKPIGFQMLAQSSRTPATVETRLFQPIPSPSEFYTAPVANYQYSVIATSSTSSASSR